MTTTSEVDWPVGTVLVHPEPTEERPGRAQPLASPSSTRIWKVDVSHGEWPWRKFTGFASEVPSQGDALDGWRVQPLWEVGAVLGHRERKYAGLGLWLREGESW